ncbi:2-phosphosulfolactate phosphatase [Tautonia sociabilis]|uniref:Probable 2-phosphosulfolactate phosphatase n=1 Tax=Tautonia sociabilis TaxID=2080755 RepID=A0A432MQT6_9BACT|nr:2-phosphosulfolactate phosphatase [Tautonia sociabilis]RUL89416.1 2-phosphosulfolactate phosphatase [Tautonia sociabilis]
MTTDRPVSVHLLPALIPPGALAGGVAVVVDVLRATTVMVHALASGSEAIVPCLEIDEARSIAAGRPPGSTLLAGERLGIPIEGFDLGNSPESFSPEACRGKTVVMTTTNGTRAILAAAEADRVLIGAFINRRAVLRHLEGSVTPIHLVCSGTDGLISFEDSLLAGWITSQLVRDHGGSFGNDAARIASGAWESVAPDPETPESLAAILARGRGGRRVTELGLRADLEAASRIDRFDLVPELHRDPVRIVASGAPGGPGIG